MGVSDNSWGPVSPQSPPSQLHLGAPRDLPAPPAVVLTLSSPALRGARGPCLQDTLPMPGSVLSHSTQKLGVSEWAVQGVTWSSPRHDAWCLPVAVCSRCCCGLGVPVGSIAPLQGGETGQAAAPTGGVGLGAAGCPMALHRVVVGPTGSWCQCHWARTSLITIPQGLSQTLTLKN